MSEVLGLIASKTLPIQTEVERDWLWITTEIGPLHRKCDCAECARRKGIRESIKEIGFRFAMGGHPLKSGVVSYWAHACDHPVRFKRRGKTSKPGDGKDEDKQSGTPSDAELLAMLG
jgi:hypothetical protein